MSEKVLDYYDILLRQGDVDTLRGSGWLNDQASFAGRGGLCGFAPSLVFDFSYLQKVFLLKLTCMPADYFILF